jgi:hypothetical protein
LEDAGDESYSLEVEEHCMLAGRWLGAMNISAQRLVLGEALPDRGAAFYLKVLRRARAMITKILGHPAVRVDDRPGTSKRLSVTAIDWKRFGFLRWMVQDRYELL